MCGSERMQDGLVEARNSVSHVLAVCGVMFASGTTRWGLATRRDSGIMCCQVPEGSADRLWCHTCGDDADEWLPTTGRLVGH